MKNEDKRICLNGLLSEYMSREPSYTFRVKREEEKVEKRDFKLTKILVCTSIVLIVALVGIGVFSNLPLKNPTDLGFMITAYAADETADNGKVLGYEVTGLNECGPLVSIEEDALHYDRITLSVTGKDVVSYDVKTVHGELNVFDRKNRIIPENALGAEVYSYFAKGSELVDLPPAPVNYPEETQLYWYPDTDRIMDDIDENGDVFAQQKMLLKSAEDFNRYFADTITVNVTYTDGKEESADIEITFDKKGYVSAVVKNNNEVVDVL